MFAGHRISVIVLFEILRENRFNLFEDLRSESPEVHRNKRILIQRLPFAVLLEIRLSIAADDLADLADGSQVFVFILLADTSGNGAVVSQCVSAEIADHCVMIVADLFA